MFKYINTSNLKKVNLLKKVRQKYFEIYGEALQICCFHENVTNLKKQDLDFRFVFYICTSFIKIKVIAVIIRDIFYVIYIFKIYNLNYAVLYNIMLVLAIDLM